MKNSFMLIVILFLLGLTSQKSEASDKKESFQIVKTLKNQYQAEPVSLGGYSLEDYLRYAALENPALKAAFYRWEAKLEHIATVNTLPDPRLTYGYFIENVETRVGPQKQKLSLMQTIPWFGTLGTKGEIAFEEANAAYQKFQAEKLKLYYKVKSAYYDYYLLGREIEITRENMELLKFWEKIVSAKYQTALSGHPDIIKAQVELGKLEDHLLTYEEKKISYEYNLLSLLNLSDSITLPIPDFIIDEDIVVNKDSIKYQSFHNNPDLLAISKIIDREMASINLAKKSYYPNFTFGVMYIETGDALNPLLNESGKDPWQVNVSINLPIWFGKNKAQKRKAMANYQGARYRYDNAQNSLDAYIEKVIFEYEDAKRKKELYRDGLIPKAEQALNAFYAAYQAGSADFLNLIDAQRQLLSFQLIYEIALTNQAKKLAEIEMVTGKEQ